jgi:hypothetical protein
LKILNRKALHPLFLVCTARQPKTPAHPRSCAADQTGPLVSLLLTVFYLRPYRARTPREHTRWDGLDGLVRAGAHQCRCTRPYGLASLPCCCAGTRGCPPRLLAKLQSHRVRPPLVPGAPATLASRYKTHGRLSLFTIPSRRCQYLKEESESRGKERSREGGKQRKKKKLEHRAGSIASSAARDLPTFTVLESTRAPPSTRLRHADVPLCCHLPPSVRTHGHPRHVVAAKSSTFLLTHYHDETEDARHLLDDRRVSRRSCRCPRTAS